MSASKLPDCPVCRQLAEYSILHGKAGYVMCSACVAKNEGHVGPPRSAALVSIEEARASAWRAALAVAHDNRNLAASAEIAAQLTIIRRLLGRLVPGGEATFWVLVEEELRK